MQELFHAMLAERRGKNEDWTKFVRVSFEKNRSWDEIARELILADAKNETCRGAAF